MESNLQQLCELGKIDRCAQQHNSESHSQFLNSQISISIAHLCATIQVSSPHKLLLTYEKQGEVNDENVTEC